MSNAFMAQLPCIGTTSTLGWSNDALAQSYMDHILQRARVLLSRRGWRVGIIKEFYPRGASLLGLNVNAGSEVCVRFRVPGKRNEFLPFHEVLCTALHEFTHCVHSRHDRAFWNLYYDVVKECEALEVTMIQEGKQLYPEAAYVATTTAAAASPPQHGRGGTAKAAGATFPGNGGHRLGGGGVRSSGRGGGGAIAGPSMTRSRSGTLTTTVPARPGRRPKPNPTTTVGADGFTPNAAFPGEGRRLGDGGGLRAFDVTPGLTPTRDALRRILAAAAERRLGRDGANSARAPAQAVNAPAVSSTTAPSSVSPLQEEKQEEEANAAEEVPDHVPLSQSALDNNGGSWKCPRCGFCNERSVHSCQFCDNDEDVENDTADVISLLEGKADHIDEPMIKKERSETTGATAAEESKENSLTPAFPPSANHGTSKDDAVEISDDDVV